MEKATRTMPFAHIEREGAGRDREIASTTTMNQAGAGSGPAMNNNNNINHYYYYYLWQIVKCALGQIPLCEATFFFHFHSIRIPVCRSSAFFPWLFRFYALSVGFLLVHIRRSLSRMLMEFIRLLWISFSLSRRICHRTGDYKEEDFMQTHAHTAILVLLNVVNVCHKTSTYFVPFGVVDYSSVFQFHLAFLFVLSIRLYWFVMFMW